MDGDFSLRNHARSLLDFLRVGIWQLEMRKLSRGVRLGVGALKILMAATRSLSQERIHLRAAGLTFYSLLSIVPVLAMLFGIAKGFGLDMVLERELLSRAQGQEEVVARMIGFAHNLLSTTKGGVVAGVGVMVLFWSVVKVFASVERGFNEVWGVGRERSLPRKATDYLALSLLCAILLAVSGTLTVLITTEVTFAVNRIRVLESVGPAILFGLRFLPLIVIWILFTLLYTVIPNTPVQAGAAAVGGVLAGTAFQLFQGLYIQFQIGVAKYNAIYGSFTALPLFLVWLQVSWLIVLVGAHISHVYQNLGCLGPGGSSLRLSVAQERLFSLLAVNLVVKHFCNVGGALPEKSIAETLRLPLYLVRRFLEALAACGVLTQVKNADAAEASYQPSLDPARLTIHEVMERLDQLGTGEFPVVTSEVFRKIEESMESIKSAAKFSPANALLKDI